MCGDDKLSSRIYSTNIVNTHLKCPFNADAASEHYPL